VLLLGSRALTSGSPVAVDPRTAEHTPRCFIFCTLARTALPAATCPSSQHRQCSTLDPIHAIRESSRHYLLSSLGTLKSGGPPWHIGATGHRVTGGLATRHHVSKFYLPERTSQHSWEPMRNASEPTPAGGPTRHPPFSTGCHKRAYCTTD
jgi:hypothetical protein